MDVKNFNFYRHLEEEWMTEDENLKHLFVEVRGKKIFWRAFIQGLDCYHIRLNANKLFGRLIYPLKFLTEDWHDGEEKFICVGAIVEQGYTAPTTDDIPSAINELFDQMEKIMRISMSDLLTLCEELSERLYHEYLAQQGKEQNRREKVVELANLCHEKESTSVFDDVQFLYSLQKMKEADSDYCNKEKEATATRLLANLILQRTISSNITCWMLKSLVSNGFFEETDVDKLLSEKYNDKRDSEWYLEDMISWDEEDETDFKVDDTLEATQDALLETIGIDKSYFYFADNVGLDGENTERT